MICIWRSMIFLRSIDTINDAPPGFSISVSAFFRLRQRFAKAENTPEA